MQARGPGGNAAGGGGSARRRAPREPRGGRSLPRGEQRQGPVPSVAAAMGAAGPQLGVRLPGRLREEQPLCRGPGPGPGGVWLSRRHCAPARSRIPDGPRARRGLRARGARAGRTGRFRTSPRRWELFSRRDPLNRGHRRPQRLLGEPTPHGGSKPWPGPDNAWEHPCLIPAFFPAAAAGAPGAVTQPAPSRPAGIPRFGGAGSGPLRRDTSGDFPARAGNALARSCSSYRGGGRRGARPGRGEQCGGAGARGGRSPGTCRRVSAPGWCSGAFPSRLGWGQRAINGYFIYIISGVP